jgi:hypothetical protein
MGCKRTVEWRIFGMIKGMCTLHGHQIEMQPSKGTQAIRAQGSRILLCTAAITFDSSEDSFGRAQSLIVLEGGYLGFNSRC